MFFDLSPTSDLLFMHIYDILGWSDLFWPIWYVISMSAALTILWNRPNVRDVLGKKKKQHCHIEPWQILYMYPVSATQSML